MSRFSLSPSAAAGGDGDSTCDSISVVVERFAVTDRSQTDNDSDVLALLLGYE